MRKANFWRDWRRWHAGRAVRGQGNLALKFQPDLAPFKYFDQGWLAVIGRWGVWGHLSGRLAWIVWACIHVINLVTFQNRFLVFFQWAIQELTFSRGARLKERIFFCFDTS